MNLNLNLDVIKKVATNRVFQIALAFVVGGFVASILLPEKIIVKKETEIVYKDKIVEKEVVKWKTKTVYVDKVVEKEVRKVWTKTTYPDGKIVETEIYESNTQQVDRMRTMEEEKYNAKISEITKEFQKKESYLMEHYNPKRFTLFAGGGTRLDDPLKYNIAGGMDVQVWGPFTIGTQVNTHKDFALTFGIRF